MVDNIDNDPSEIYFCEVWIGVKITKNRKKKQVSALTENLKGIHMNLWRPPPDISLQKNRYM